MSEADLLREIEINKWDLQETEKFYVRWEDHHNHCEYMATIQTNEDEKKCEIIVEFNNNLKKNSDNESEEDDVPTMETIDLNYSIRKTITKNTAFAIMQIIYEWLASDTCNYLMNVRKISPTSEHHPNQLLAQMKKIFPGIAPTREIGFFGLGLVFDLFRKN